MIQKVNIDYPSLPERKNQRFEIHFQIFGKPLHQAPIILVNHALTGNSNVAGIDGWWQELIGENKTINLKNYTVIAINIPGNGYNQSEVFENYQDFTTKMIAELFWNTLDHLQVKELFAVIGGSLGGSIGWEMAFLRHHAIQNLIPIACSIKSSDWLIGNVKVQERILLNSRQPVEDARMHAMLLYRTPLSLYEKFKTQRKDNQYLIENWLEYHGKTLNKRFQHSSYLLMNHLLKTIGTEITEKEIEDFAKNSTTKIHSIAIDTDYMFTKEEQFETYQKLKKLKAVIQFHEIKSVHGHDAFLIEYPQLSQLIKPIFLCKS